MIKAETPQNPNAPTAQDVLGTAPTAAPQANAPAATETAAPAAPVERMSPKLHAIVQRERAALERDQKAKAREAAAEERERALADREARLQEFESLKGTKPLQALEKLGLSYQQLTQAALNDGDLPPEAQVKRVEEKFDSYLKEQEAKAQANLEQAKLEQAQKEEQAKVEYVREIASYIEEHASTYELIRFEQQIPLIYEVIDMHYERTIDPETGIGKVMSMKEAADMVEAHLDKKYEGALGLNKIKSKLQPPTQSNPGAKPNTQATKPPLTNQNIATSSNRRGPVTDEERVQKAIAYARGLRP